MSEKIEHKQIVAYIKAQYPNVIFRTDYSAGIKLRIGQAVAHQQLQSCKGFPDITIFHANDKYHALLIELKKTGEKLFKKDGITFKSEHLEQQNKVHKQLLKSNYYATFAIGFLEAKQIIDNYFKNNL
jgi:hypothetical protein